MKIPSAWETILLAAASYRIWRLLAEDTILNRPRRWLVRLPKTWVEGDPTPENYRWKIAYFMNCPWCFGLWISLAAWIAWLIEPTWSTGLSVPLAISAAVGITRDRLDGVE